MNYIMHYDTCDKLLTGDKSIIGVNDNGVKLATGVKDTGNTFITGVLDTGYKTPELT